MMVLHANPKLLMELRMDAVRQELLVSCKHYGSTMEDYTKYTPSFSMSFPPRTADSNRLPRYIGTGEFSIKGLSYTDTLTKPKLPSENSIRKIAEKENIPLDNQDNPVTL